jgi:beta-glucosidase
MLGDSITHGWENEGGSVWKEFYQSKKAFNLRFSGDRTEHVLGRLQHGAVDNMSLKLTAVMIGTNNTSYRMDPAEHTA